MKAGKVATIRLRPEDCMSVVDILDRAKVNTTGMTFAAAVATAVGIAMATLRDNGVLPTRQGFEYTELMDQFVERPKVRSIKLPQQFSEIAVEGLSMTGARVTNANNSAPVSTELRQAQIRLNELEIKKTHASDSWSDTDEEEYQKLTEIVFSAQ